MKRISKIQIDRFILSLLQDASISKIIDNWSIEYEVIVKEIAGYLTSIGIYEVDPVKHKKIVLETIKVHLYNNMGIQSRISELLAAQEEQIARKKRQSPGTS